MEQPLLSLSLKSNVSRDDRSAWPWLTGTAGILGAALSPEAHGEIVQITQVGNSVETVSGVFDDSNLDADFTGDEMDDPATFNAAYATVGLHRRIRFDLSNTVSALNYLTVGYSDGNGGLFRIGKPPLQQNNGVAFTRSYLFPIVFTDSRINNGDVTEAFMQVTASHQNSNSFSVELIRLIFDDENTTRPGASIGTTYPEWQEATPPPPTMNIDSAVIDIIVLKKQIKKAKKKIKKAKKSGKKAKLKKLKKKLKKLKQQL